MPEETKTTEEPKAKTAKGPVACGHENKHYIPPAGEKGKRLFCTLEKGHQPVRVVRTGPKGEDLSTVEVIHSAPYTTGKGKDSVAYWSDAAGVELPKEILAKHAPAQ